MPISTEEAVIARLSHSGQKFEILVDPKKALEVKKGKDVPPSDLVVIQEVFEDSAKGKKCSEEDINKAFGTNNFKDIAYKIIRKGEVHLTTEQRREMRKEKRDKIANIISRRSVDPQRNTPHPPKRVKKAMDEAGVKIDGTKNAEAQVERIVEKLRPIIPISMEMAKVAVKIPPKYTGKAYGKVKDFGKIKKEDWKDDGSWIGVVEIPAGMQGDFYNLLNSITKGEVETKIVKK